MPTLSSDADSAGDQLTDAEQFTRRLAHGHYENFSVISLLLPRHLRQDFCNVYAYCRTADDLADEVADRGESVRMLGEFREQLHQCYAGRPSGPIFVALARTIETHAIPVQPFDDLLDAFEQDQRVNRYQTFAEVVDYCRRSADPVGRLVLWMCGYHDPYRQRLSDQTCTALQLANFWQDVRRDLLDRDRIYLPMETMQRFGMSEQTLRSQVLSGDCDDRARGMIRFEVERAEMMFDEGEKLLPLLDRSVRGQISLFGEGGRAVLTSIRQQNYNTLATRPRLSKLQKGRLIATALMNKLIIAARPWPATITAVEAKA